MYYDENDSIDKSLNFNNKNWLLFNKSELLVFSCRVERLGEWYDNNNRRVFCCELPSFRFR